MNNIETVEVGGNKKPLIFQDDKPLPDLSLNKGTVSYLARILLGGGAEDHSFENGSSKNISAKLSSGKDGFLDEATFQRNVSL